MDKGSCESTSEDKGAVQWDENWPGTETQLHCMAHSKPLPEPGFLGCCEVKGQTLFQ